MGKLVCPCGSQVMPEHGQAELAHATRGTLLRRHQLRLVLQGGIERMPCHRRTIHAGRIAAHAGEGFQLAEAGPVARRGHILQRGAGHQLVELLEEAPRLADCLALDGFGHHRCRCRRDGAPGALEGDVLHDVVADRDVDRYAVPAQRVIPFGLAVRRLGPPEVARLAVVIEDQLLIELVQVGHHVPVPKISTHWRTPATRASMSSRVLYRATDARHVAGTPNLCMTGWAQ